ncbi:MAG: hypothetical protein AAF597_08935, partial [Bacteroidota bacterium]
WPLVLLTCLGLFIALYLYLRYEERSKLRLVAQREQSDGAPHFWRIELPQLHAEIDWGEDYPALVRQLRRRREDDYQLLDLPQTIKATVSSGGLPKFRYRSATRPAEYLLLIDRGTADNHQARLFEGLYQQLVAEEVLVDRYFYSGDPRLLYQEDRGQTTKLSQLARRYPEARLFLVGSGDRLLNAASGKLAKWVPDLLGGWESKSLLSTLPTKEWGRRERQLGSFLTVLPASMQGLKFLVQRLNDDATEADKVDYRNLVSDAARETVVLRADQSFIDSLREVYSPAKLKWLAACALYPALHWDLTLFLGKTVDQYLQEPLLSSQNLLSLSRLPWFANGSMPEPARRELADWVRAEHPALHDHLRQAIHGLLEKADLPPVGSAARRDLDFYRQQNEWLLAAPDSPERARLGEDLARRIANGEEPDTTIVRVMEQPSGDEITLPDSWKERLYPEGFPGFGVKNMWRKLAVESQGIWLLLLLAFIFRPEEPRLEGGCSAQSKIWQIRDTVNYAQDTMVTIQFCDKLDSLVMAEYTWNHRIKSAIKLVELDTLPLSVQMTPLIDEEGKTNMTFTGATTLRNLLTANTTDSLLTTHQQNIGAMLFNRALEFRNADGYFSYEACDFFEASSQLFEWPLPEYRKLVDRICSPNIQQGPEDEREPDIGPEQTQPLPESSPNGTTVTVPPETPEDPKALLFRRGERLVDALAELKANILRRFPDRGSRIDNLIRR